MKIRKKRLSALAVLLSLSMLSSMGVYAAGTPDDFVSSVGLIPLEEDINEDNLTEVEAAIAAAEAEYNALADKTSTSVTNAKAQLDNLKRYVDLAKTVLPTSADSTKDIKIKKITYAMESTGGTIIHTATEGDNATYIFSNLRAAFANNATTIRQEKAYSGTGIPVMTINHTQGKYGYEVPEFTALYDNCEEYAEQYKSWMDAGSTGDFNFATTGKSFAGDMKEGWVLTRVLIDDSIEVTPDKGFVPSRGWDENAEHTLTYYVTPKYTFTVNIDKDNGVWDSYSSEFGPTLQYRSVRSNEVIENFGNTSNNFKLNGFSQKGWVFDGVEYDKAFNLPMQAGKTYNVKVLYVPEAYAPVVNEWTATVNFLYADGTTALGTRTAKSTGDTAKIQTQVEPTVPEGKRFVEWNTKADGTGDKYAANVEMVVLKDNPTINLYAITADTQGGDKPTNPDDGNKPTNPDDGNKPTNPDDGNKPTNPPAATDWTATIKYNANGGTGTIADATGKATTSTQKIVASDGTGFSKDGMKFKGWNTKADGSGTAYDAKAEITISKDNPSLELFAQWEEDKSWTASITYFANGATGTVEKQTKTTDGAEYEFTLYKADNLTRDGYTFDGWNTKADGSGTSYKVGDKLKVAKGTPNVELYAKWKQIKKWTATIKYNVNGGSGEISATTTEVTDKDSIEVTVKKADGFTYDGYTFSHWNTKSDGSGTKIEPEKKVTIKEDASTLELYAIWNKIEPWTATIKYNANGATGAIADATQSVTDKDSVEMTISKGDGLTREGYMFNGWNTKADGSGTSYSADSKVTIKMDSKTLELFAQWKGTTPETANGNAQTKATGGAVTGSPQTSDSTDFIMPIVMMIGSLACIAFVLRKRLFNFHK